MKAGEKDMKIAQVIPNFGIGGAEIMCESLIYELLKLKHDVVVISMYNYNSAITDRLESAGINIHYLNKRKGIDISMIKKMKDIFLRESVEIVHTHLYCVEYAVPAAVLTGINHVIHTVHSIAYKENGYFGKFLENIYFKKLKTIPVALSPLIQDSISKEYNINAKNIPIVFNGIDLSKCLVKTNYEANDIFTILHIGRFSHPKNHIGLLNAFVKFHNKYPNSKLQLIGDGETKNEAKTFVKNNKLDDCVEFLGIINNVYGYLHDADVFALPSHYEGIPMTLIEAMATGLPIVATAVGGVTDMLHNNKDAILTNVETDEIYHAFERYYTSKDIREQFGKKAKINSKNFSSKKMTDNYLKLYINKL